MEKHAGHQALSTQNSLHKGHECSLGLASDAGLHYYEEAERLQKFKDYVHERLDKMGVPTHPNGPHSDQGCRIGDRLDYVSKELAESYGPMTCVYCRHQFDEALDSYEEVVAASKRHDLECTKAPWNQPGFQPLIRSTVVADGAGI